MWPENICLPVKVYGYIVILALVLSCLINIFVDYFNNIGLFYSISKNIGSSFCCCASSVILVLILAYFCAYPIVAYGTWAAVILMLLCSFSSIAGNFFYVYSYNPVLII